MAVTDDAIAAIKAMIRSGDLQPGDRLPREADLAAAVGVSRNSLREAVRALSLVRILDVRQGDGTYVSDMSPENLIEALNFLLEFRQDAGVIEFFEVRRILEPAAAALAARSMTTASVRELRALIEQSSSATDVADLVQHDVTFHAAMARGAGNSVLASIIESISMPTARARIWRGLTEDDAVARTLAEHQAIVDAIADGDDQLASARTLSHISGVLAWLRRAEDNGDGPGSAALSP